jgi:hypothetical protein
MKIVRYIPTTTFEVPSEGLHHARLGKIKDLDPAPNPQGGEPKERCRFIWEIQDQVNSSGEALKVYQTFNLTLHPRGFLYQAIAAITGTEPGMQFDLDSLLNVEVDLVLRHNKGSDQRTYCNVASILKPTQAAELRRVQAATTRVSAEARRPHASQADSAEITDEDESSIPF